MSAESHERVLSLGSFLREREHLFPSLRASPYRPGGTTQTCASVISGKSTLTHEGGPSWERGQDAVGSTAAKPTTIADLIHPPPCLISSLFCHPLILFHPHPTSLLAMWFYLRRWASMVHHQAMLSGLSHLQHLESTLCWQNAHSNSIMYQLGH